MIFRLGHDERSLVRSELETAPQIAEVLPDQVTGLAHAGHPTTA